MTYIVALTGGIGCGKTTVSNLFKERDIETIDADEIAHAITKPGQEGYEKVVAAFGPGYLNHDSSIDRKKLRQLVFQNHNAKTKLESLLHPIIGNEIDSFTDSANSPFVIVGIPLLLENGANFSSDRVLIIDCPPQMQINRVKIRSGLKTEEVHKIIRAQVTRTKRLEFADDLIKNISNIDNLRSKVHFLHNIYLNLAFHKSNYCK